MYELTVHIVTHNNETSIDECLTSLYKQTYHSFFAILIDNNSADKTITKARKFPIKIIKNKKNIGYAAAHNQAISITSNPFILTLNPDVILTSDYLKLLMNFAKRTEFSIGSITGKLLRIEHIQQKSSQIDGMGIYISKNRRQGLQFENKFERSVPNSTFTIFGPDGAVALYRRKMLLDIAQGGEIFDTDFFMHKEDIDVCWRARLRGWNSVCFPKAKAYHIRTFRPGQRTKIPQWMKTLAIRNRYFLLIKNDSFQNIFLDFFHIFIYEIKIFSYILLFEQQSFVAYIQVLGYLPKLLQKRQIIQKNSLISAKDLHKWFV